MTRLSNLPSGVKYDLLPSEVGQLVLFVDDAHLVGLLWNSPSLTAELSQFQRTRKHEVLTLAKSQLREYFARKRKSFDIPIKFYGTAFQKKAWRALGKIPYGETFSYGQQARAIGSPKAFRAVGSANGRNLISIVVPCHRVIAGDGSLGGFGGGLCAKEFLLKLESENS